MSIVCEAKEKISLLGIIAEGGAGSECSSKPPRGPSNPTGAPVRVREACWKEGYVDEEREKFRRALLDLEPGKLGPGDI